jgi:hypothetical protein
MSAQFLRLKEGPYLLTLLVAASAWLIAHTVDRLRSAPIVEYQLREEADGDGTAVTCRFENLCVDRCFRDLEFTLTCPEGSCRFTNCQVKIFLPAKTRKQPSLRPNETGKQFSIVFEEFHPRWAFAVRARKIGNVPCQVQVASAQDENERLPASIEVVELVPAGFCTFLMRHEIEILFGLLVLSATLITAYLKWLNKVAAGGAHPKTPVADEPVPGGKS